MPDRVSPDPSVIAPVVFPSDVTPEFVKVLPARASPDPNVMTPVLFPKEVTPEVAEAEIVGFCGFPVIVIF